MEELARQYAAERDGRNAGTYDPAAGPESLRQNQSPLGARPEPRQLDPASVRQQQNRLLIQQRAVDQQIRALRRQRARGGELSPEQINQLAQLEQQAVDLRRGKVDMFRLGNELEGRGPLSPTEAEASRLRLAEQIPDARRSVLEQAKNENDVRFRRMAEREAAGVPDYRPEGMADAEADRLYSEMAGPTPGEARASFLAGPQGITPGGSATTQHIRNTERVDREVRMQQIREQERLRQARELRERGIANDEADRALDIRETQGRIAEIQSENAVQRAQNQNRAAEVEGRGLELAGRQLDQQIESISQLGEAQLELASAEIQQAIAEARAAAEAAPRDVAARQRLQELEGEFKAVQLQQAIKTLEEGPRIDPQQRKMVVDGIADAFVSINGQPIRGGRIADLGVMRSAVDTIARMPSEADRRSVASEVLNRIRALNGDLDVEGSRVPFTQFADWFRIGEDAGDATDKLKARRKEQERIIAELMQMAGVTSPSEEG